MVGKVSERVLQRQGLERTDNGMRLTSWPEISPLNQKNYYTEYMKRDDQILSLRIEAEESRKKLVQAAKERDRALNTTAEASSGEGDLQPDDGPAPSTERDLKHVIVIHPGSQNLRIGLASDALPKTVPMVLARKFRENESENEEALPRRHSKGGTPEEQYGDEFSKKYAKMCGDLKFDMRANKRKVLPNSKDLVVNFNRRVEPDVILQHNDPLQIDWTEVKTREPTRDDARLSHCMIVGQQALRIPEDSDPKFRVSWPIQRGWLNENDYSSRAHLLNDVESILDHAIRHDLGINTIDCVDYDCVVIIPDLYDKRYVAELLKSCSEWFEFRKVSFVLESVAAAYGAGYSQACVVDVGAQKTSVACVEDGMIMEDSRINLKYGGWDVTETFIKMMLHDSFPYQEINLRRRYDWLLAEELKITHCTLTQATISVQNSDFHVRAPNQPTRKYQFKFYDEVILAPMGFYDPSIFDNSRKLKGRHKLIDRSYNAYDVDQPDDPVSKAQTAILAYVEPSVIADVNVGATTSGLGIPSEFATPSKERGQAFDFVARVQATGTPGTSKAPSPAPEGLGLSAPYVFGSQTNGGSPAPSGRNGGTPGPQIAANASAAPPPGMFTGANQRTSKEEAEARDKVLPVAPLDVAIMTSVEVAAKGDDKKFKELLGTIMLVGGGAKIPHFAAFLEDRLKASKPHLAEKILVSRSAREMDEQVVVWKGASIWARIPNNDSWVTKSENDFFGARAVHNRAMWQW